MADALEVQGVSVPPLDGPALLVPVDGWTTFITDQDDGGRVRPPRPRLLGPLPNDRAERATARHPAHRPPWGSRDLRLFWGPGGITHHIRHELSRPHEEVNRSPHRTSNRILFDLKA
ncbi:hypothetical protein GCM10018773_21110 [Streptomyces candidus]|nr:hypothetical protein GCM10018773_21110 [Streptomyces candidus]